MLSKPCTENEKSHGLAPRPSPPPPRTRIELWWNKALYNVTISSYIAYWIIMTYHNDYTEYSKVTGYLCCHQCYRYCLCAHSGLPPCIMHFIGETPSFTCCIIISRADPMTFRSFVRLMNIPLILALNDFVIVLLLLLSLLIDCSTLQEKNLNHRLNHILDLKSIFCIPLFNELTIYIVLPLLVNVIH